ncbi:putative polyamine transporter [Prunus yedoensis var. nudiflora]|uniref:Putative polyamine transporter n=1 Tax=Prunus yedoensis var. nudiflora TaxID=2094558 RepID=A0A314YWN2_PRUYE|nr:putative polyamine transporter [Prunus yedoensis var. nudiflora]
MPSSPKPPILEDQILPLTTTTTITTHRKKLTLIPLIFLIYFEVAGGPYGEEPAVQAPDPFSPFSGSSSFLSSGVSLKLSSLLSSPQPSPAMAVLSSGLRELLVPSGAL